MTSSTVTAPPTRRGAATRQRVLTATIALLAERGATGTGLNQIVEASGVSYGSVYHQFRDGKDSIVAAAVDRAGTDIGDAIDAVFDTSDTLADACATMFAYGAALLTSSDFASGCPVGTAIADGHRSDAIRVSADEAFDRWQQLIAERAVGFGASAAGADRFASAAVSLYEGALLVGRAQRSTEPLEHAGAAASVLAEAVTS